MSTINTAQEELNSIKTAIIEIYNNANQSDQKVMLDTARRVCHERPKIR